MREGTYKRGMIPERKSRASAEPEESVFSGEGTQRIDVDGK